MHLFISPHLDDAVLSCGGFMAALVESDQPVVAATLFTADRDSTTPLSDYASYLHAIWGVSDPFNMRRQEDIESLGLIGARYVHLGLLDAIYRFGLAEGEVYPDNRSVFSGRAAQWEIIGDTIAAEVDRLVRELNPCAIYIPLGVGRHVDHIVTRDAVIRMRPELSSIYLYEDMPYSAGAYPPHAPDNVASALGRLQEFSTRPKIVPISFATKMKAINTYASQIEELSAGADFDETVRTYSEMVGDGSAAERYWQIG